MTTRAERDGDAWRLSGVKTFISNAGIADAYVVFAKTDVKAGAKGVSAFLVPGDADGIEVDPLRAMAAHPLGTLRFDDVRLEQSAIVGAEGGGFKVALATLDVMRPTVAAAAVGFGQRALDASVARAKQRRQFDAPIAENQGLRWMLADGATRLEAARLLAYRAAWLKDQGHPRITQEAAQAKLAATETAQRLADLCVQVHGGSGVMAGSLPDRLYREVRALRIYEGTSEILRDLVARGLFA
jgi:acyl-CoA dehydrogenase